MWQAHSYTGNSENGRLPTEQWQGQEVAFMRSNEHSQDRRGSWHPEGLDGAALHLVQGDEKNGRYRYGPSRHQQAPYACYTFTQ